MFDWRRTIFEMDGDPVAENFEAFLDSLSPVSTLAQNNASPSTPYTSPMFNSTQELIGVLQDDILSPSPSPAPFQMSQHKLYKKPQESRKSTSEEQGYSAHTMVNNIRDSLQYGDRTKSPDKLTVVVEQLKARQIEQKITKICGYIKPHSRKSTEEEKKNSSSNNSPRKSTEEEKKSSRNSPRKSTEEEKKSSNKNDDALAPPKVRRRRRSRIVEMTPEEVREKKRLRFERKKKLKQIAETEKRRSSAESSLVENKKNLKDETREVEKRCQSITINRSNNESAGKKHTEKKKYTEKRGNMEKNGTADKKGSTVTEKKGNKEKKATQENCHSHITKEKAAHRSSEKHSKRRHRDGPEESEPKRRKIHEHSPVKPTTLTENPLRRPGEVTIKEEIVDLTEEFNSSEITIKQEIVDLTEACNTMCVNLKFATESVQHFLTETCEELPPVRTESTIKQEVEAYLFRATTSVATFGTQTTEFSRSSSAMQFAKVLAGYVRDFHILNRTLSKSKTQLIEDLEGNVSPDVLVEELKELSRYSHGRFAKIGDKLCGKLAKVHVPNFNFPSILSCASSQLAQATPSILLAEQQIWHHLATMLKSCHVEAASETFKRFFKEALKPPDEFETPEVQFYKKEIGWGENVPNLFDTGTHEVPSRLRLSIRAVMPFQSPNQCHFYHSEEIIDLT